MSKNQLTYTQVAHIATLAHLNLNADQLAIHAGSLSAVMNHMAEIKKIDLSQVEATSRVTDQENVVREDVVGSSLTQEQALQNASRTHEGYFVVNAILNDKGG